MRTNSFNPATIRRFQPGFDWLFLILLALGFAVDPARSQERLAVITDDGAWGWFSDPRAVMHQGVLYVGFVRSSEPRAVLRAFNPKTGVGTDLWASSFLDRDDFNVPSILVRPDGRMVAAFARHGRDPYFYYRVSHTPFPTNATMWGPERRSVAISERLNYANLFRLGAEGRMFNLVRTESGAPTFFVSSDGGMSWARSQSLIHGPQGEMRPYVKLASDGEHRADLLFTPSHPREFTASLYHVAYHNGALRKSDGTILKSWNQLPLVQGKDELGSLVYEYRAEPQEDPDEWIPDGRPLPWDMVQASNGYPVCVFAVSLRQPEDWTTGRTYYYYARWTGTNWQRRFIAQAGRPLYASEQQYAGGICIDPDNPGVVYLSSNAADPFQLQELNEVPLQPDARFELWRGVTHDGGLNFTWEPVTSNSEVDNLRPVVPKGSGAVLWFRGRYWSYTAFRSEIVGLFPEPVPQVQTGMQWGTLTNAAQVRALNSAEAARNFPVKLRGVVVAEPQVGGRGCVIIDDTAGIYWRSEPHMMSNLRRGDLVEVEGFTDPGQFAPFVSASSVRVIGRGEVPEPTPVSFEQLISGRFDSQWVELSGIVRTCQELIPGRKYQLDLATGGGRIAVQIFGEHDPEALIDAEVRFAAVSYYTVNRSRQVISPLLVVPAGGPFEMERSGPVNPYAAPILPSASLLQFAPHGTYGHRVHMRGVVTHHVPGETFWIRDESGGLRVQSAQTNRLQPGDLVDVLGFPSRGNYSPMLEDAVFRKRQFTAPPAPLLLTNVAMALNNDANLVQLEATLTDKQLATDGWALILQSSNTTFRALLRSPDAAPLPAEWEPLSRVRATGISAVSIATMRPPTGVAEPRSFELHLRSPADLQVIQPPPWWTWERIVWLLTAVALGLLLVIGVVIWMAKQRLREQAVHRALAEAEFGAILNERNRMAREIHDTLAQGLSAISMQLEVTKSRLPESSPAAHDSLEQAHSLVRNSLAEARNSIWNMRSQVLENNDLGSALSGILQQLTAGRAITGRVQVRGRPRRLPPVTENNLLRIGQEAITNAVTHARATSIDVELEFMEKEVRLRVADNGGGFDTANPPASDSGFGLVGMRERAADLHGSLNIDSTPGRGTELKLSVPVAS